MEATTGELSTSHPSTATRQSFSCAGLFKKAGALCYQTCSRSLDKSALSHRTTKLLAPPSPTHQFLHRPASRRPVRASLRAPLRQRRLPAGMLSAGYLTPIVAPAPAPAAAAAAAAALARTGRRRTGPESCSAPLPCPPPATPPVRAVNVYVYVRISLGRVCLCILWTVAICSMHRADYAADRVRPTD